MSLPAASQRSLTHRLACMRLGSIQLVRTTTTLHSRTLLAVADSGTVVCFPCSAKFTALIPSGVALALRDTRRFSPVAEGDAGLLNHWYRDIVPNVGSSPSPVSGL